MDSARIADLLSPFLACPLSEAQLTDISMYIDILIQWNQKLNLTAVRDPEEIVTRHFGESLFAAQHLLPAPMADSQPPADNQRPTTNNRVIDVGSGAGFPGYHIKI